MMRRVAVVAALVALAPAAPAGARAVRVFVVNPRVELRYAAAYTDYRDKMFALVDGLHPRRAELVQDGVLDIAAHLRPRDPDAPADALIVFPEDVGLVAGLIGSRGEGARAVTLEQGGSTVAFVELFGAYQPQIQYYVQQWPGLPGLAGLFLAETDTYYRAFYETFRDLAMTYGVYVAASVNVAPARRIESADAPDLVAFLRDPDEAATRSYAYEAVAPTPLNTLFVFTPEGELLALDEHGATVRSPSETAGVLRGGLDKAYLTDLEQSPLGLAFGAVRRLDVLDTPLGRLASVTSKDAWMIDVNDRYDAKRPELVVQAEAFDSWAFGVDPWLPDGFKDGGFAQVQRNPSFLFNLTPCLVGNLFDVTFDGQGAVIGKRHKPLPSDAPTAWIGQNPDRGFVAVAPWIVGDPVLAQPALTLAQRRTQLVESGVALLPGSGVPCATPNGPGACENGYRESILQADLTLPDDGRPAARVPGPTVTTGFDPARFPDLPVAGEQRHPRLAAQGGTVAVAWEDSRAGMENIFLGISQDDGATFAVQRVSDHPAGAVVELRPDVAMWRGELFVVWQEFCEGRDDDCGRIELARFDVEGRKLAPDLRVDTGADTAGKWNPALALDHGGNPLIAWVDERDRSPGGQPLEHIYFSRGRNRGASMGRTVRVDRGMPTSLAVELDNKWAPAVAAQSASFFVAWTDFRNYQWDIYASRSRTGTGFEPNRRVDDAVGLERLHDHPALATDRAGTLHAVWADRRNQEPVTDIRYAHSTDGGRHFSASVIVDPSARDVDPDTGTPSNQWHPVLAVDGADVYVAWQDNRSGDNDIFLAASRDGGTSFGAGERVDDSGDDPSDQYRPALAVDPGRALYAAWEDQRYGPAAIAVARGPLEP